MSRGGYSAAIDIWGLGCILGELLHRVAHVGSAATPNLQARSQCCACCACFATFGDLGSFVSAAAPNLQARAQCCACFALLETLDLLSRRPCQPAGGHPWRTFGRSQPSWLPGIPAQNAFHAKKGRENTCVLWSQVAPLFAIHDMPKTPGDGDQFVGGPGNQTTRIELQVLL